MLRSFHTSTHTPAPRHPWPTSVTCCCSFWEDYQLLWHRQQQLALAHCSIGHQAAPLAWQLLGHQLQQAAQQYAQREALLMAYRLPVQGHSSCAVMS